ncbi:hypothetical protein [Metabacillus sp. 84]|uniref:hypothetical protein n=1 Tax=Metabacillus sp. 84 TaxID=3404705 RepID=UPI003CEC7FF4
MFSADALIQTSGNIVGGTAGAFLGGYFAIKVMRTQIEFQRKQNQQEKEEQYEKTYWLMKLVFEGLGSSIDDFQKTMNKPDIDDKKDYPYLIGLLKGTLSVSKEKKELINDNYIPKDIYREYLAGITLFNSCEFIIERWYQTLHLDNFKISTDNYQFKDLIVYGNGMRHIFNEIESIKPIKKKVTTTGGGAK